MSTILHTDKLTLKPVLSGDQFNFFPLYQIEEAVRYLPAVVHKTPEETTAWLDAKLAKDGAFLWAIFIDDADKPIGFVNYLGDSRIPGMGYVLLPDYWGQGIAPEACRAVLDYGFEHLGYDRVELWIDERNAGSHRVAQKLGFKIKDRVPLRFSDQEQFHFLLIYGMKAGEWREDLEKAPELPAPIFRVEPVLAVPDVLETANYYRDKLGFHIDFLYGDPPIHAAISCGEWTGSGATLQLTQQSEEQGQPTQGYLYLFTDTRLDELFNLFHKRGVDIVSEPKDQPWAMHEFSIRDLNGQMLVFATY